ncbi:MAG: RdgB/HAM1 family non-canonical purine NTP pyrophosphatase [Myxococcales bacterium]
MKLFFATANAGKLRELRELARDLGLEVASLADRPSRQQIPETGDSFAANAILKAEGWSQREGFWALADDSGLCVDALAGAPGIHSARWSGSGDEGNNARLLRELEGLPPERRGAEYRCALALSDGRDSYLVEAGCRGRIASAPRGAGGFGYDPLFESIELGFRTFGEATAEEKARLSHRAKAFQQLRPILELLAKPE